MSIFTRGKFSVSGRVLNQVFERFIQKTHEHRVRLLSERVVLQHDGIEKDDSTGSGSVGSVFMLRIVTGVLPAFCSARRRGLQA